MKDYKMKTFRRRLVKAGLSLLLTLPTIVSAACTLGVSSPNVDLGTVVYNAGPDSEIPGYRRVGHPRSSILSVLCDADRKALQLNFSNIAGINRDLLMWDAGHPAAAMQLRVARATADGIAVNLVANDRSLVTSLNIARDGDVLTLDLSTLPKGARAFMVEMQATGFVDKNFVPTSATGFTLTPRVQLLNP